LDEGSALRKAATYTGQQKHKRRQISMPRVGYESTIPVSEREKTFRALHRPATVTGNSNIKTTNIKELQSPKSQLSHINITCVQIFTSILPSLQLTSSVASSTITNGLPNACGDHRCFIQHYRKHLTNAIIEINLTLK
jgi:hypothetical protein